MEALLAPEEVEPSDLDVPVPEGVGGYGTGMTVAAAWLAGLVALLTVGRRKDERAAVREPAALDPRRPPAPLVARASTRPLHGGAGPARAAAARPLA